jgi:hypothetical protein
MKKKVSKLQEMSSEESDPISCSGGMVVAEGRQGDQEGILLEVVLNSGGGKRDDWADGGWR